MLDEWNVSSEPDYDTLTVNTGSRMNTEARALLQRITLAAILIASLALFFSTALGLVDGDLSGRFGPRLRVTGFFLLLGILPLCLAWPRPSATRKQSALRTLLDIGALSAIHGAYLHWYWRSAERALPFFCLGLALYCCARLAGIELDRSKRATEARSQGTSAWSSLRPRLVIGFLVAMALGTLAGVVGKLLLRDPTGLFPMIRGGVAFTVCAIFPGFVGKWVMEAAHREPELPIASSTKGTDSASGPAPIATGESTKLAAESAVIEATENRPRLHSLAGRRVIRRGCTVGGALVPALPALAGALTMNVKYAVLIAITGHLCYWGEFWSCYWDWRRRL